MLQLKSKRHVAPTIPGRKVRFSKCICRFSYVSSKTKAALASPASFSLSLCLCLYVYLCLSLSAFFPLPLSLPLSFFIAFGKRKLFLIMMTSVIGVHTAETHNNRQFSSRFQTLYTVSEYTQEHRQRQ